MISVIVPAHDAEKTLPACLEAILHQQPFRLGSDFELIVVDDGSRDSTPEIARRCGAMVISQANAGPASARNAGARSALGKLLVFTDADCAPLPDWLKEITAPFADPAVVGVKGVYRSHQSEIMARFVQLEYSYKYQRMEKLPIIDFIDTYSAAYRRQVFLENGGFNTSFPVPSVEDQEFSFRLARKGYRMRFAPRAAVYHFHDRTLLEYARRKAGIGFWKAYLLNWLPEKFFNDSHTSPSQRWQILLLFFSGLFLLISPLFPAATWLALAAALAFYLTALPMLRFIAAQDVAILPAASGLLLVRAAALGLGLAGGFIIPHRQNLHARCGPNLVEKAIKRSIDIFISIIGLAISAPFLLALGILIKLDSPGPVFFSQLRSGERGQPFKLRKLRTMVQGAEQQLNDVLDIDALSEPVFKIENDPRITRFGRFLRRTSLDELPQLWNVLVGEMSLVGPRPEQTWLIERYNDYQRQRLAVKPGLTGPMQISGRADLSLARRIELEMDYIQNYSLKLDLLILLKSIPAVLQGKGAY